MSAQNIYDNQTFFEGYQKLRENTYCANNVIERPALFSLLPPLEGKAVLDLGCGCGENCAEFLRRGCSKVVGVDVSENMLAAAQSEHPEITFVRADMSELHFAGGSFDVATSSLAVHYVPDFAALAKSVYSFLKPNGVFVFSQEHPLTTAPLGGSSWTRGEEGTPLHYNLTDYGLPGERSVRWLVDGVIKYHRTFSDIANALCEAGFRIERLLEPLPTESDIEMDKSWLKCRHKPDFLLIRAKKAE